MPFAFPHLNWFQSIRFMVLVLKTLLNQLPFLSLSQKRSGPCPSLRKNILFGKRKGFTVYQKTLFFLKGKEPPSFLEAVKDRVNTFGFGSGMKATFSSHKTHFVGSTHHKTLTICERDRESYFEKGVQTL